MNDQIIKNIIAYRKNSHPLSEKDWVSLRCDIADAVRETNSDQLKQEGTEAIQFYNLQFPEA
jgi:hypothetical protein